MQPHPRYQPLEKIASGSFASVYRGKDVELGREVAIKQIHDQYLSDPQQLERYWAEAQLLASYPHPNIVTIYDIVRDRGWLWTIDSEHCEPLEAIAVGVDSHWNQLSAHRVGTDLIVEIAWSPHAVKPRGEVAMTEFSKGAAFDFADRGIPLPLTPVRR